MKSRDLQLRLLYPEKVSFRTEGQIKCFPENVKLKEFIITKPLLQEMLRVLLYEKEELSTTESKKQTKMKETTRTDTESYGDHLEGYRLGGERGRKVKMVQGLRSIIGKNKIDRGV